MKTKDLPKTSASAEFLQVVTAIKGYLLYLQEMGMKALPFKYGGPSPSDRAPSASGRVAEPKTRIVQESENIVHPKSRALQAIRETLGDCRRCKLHTHRTQIVFGTGNPMADLVFVGEGPGEEEDRQGEPFVGKAGQLLNRMIQAMGLRREAVYIANIVKCRPPNNRNPEPDEIASCEPFLMEQLGVIRPAVICALGNFAAQTLLRTKVKISQLRGKFHDYQGIKVMPTFHPAYLLRNPKDKRLAWEDLQKIMSELKQI
ncbi:MAG: uracil-DNA glycosylase [Nitrospiria bacterium]